MVTSADDDGQVGPLAFTGSWVVQAAFSCTTRTMKQKGGTTLPQRQLYHCHLDLTGSAERACDPDLQLTSEFRLAFYGKEEQHECNRIAPPAGTDQAHHVGR